MTAIRINDFIITSFHKDKKLKVTKNKTGYKKDCFDTDIGERFFRDNRFNSWIKVRNEQQKKSSKLSKV